MAVCPNCERYINSLDNIQEFHTRKLSLDDDGNADHEDLLLERGVRPQYCEGHHVRQADVIDQYYLCPLCGERLFTSEEQAVAFLRGEKVAKAGEVP